MTTPEQLRRWAAVVLNSISQQLRSDEDELGIGARRHANA
jgi:hypothetical protein